MAKITKGKRRYLVRVYRSLMELRKIHRELYGQPILTYQELRTLNDKWSDIMRQLNENCRKTMEAMGVPESYLMVDVPIRRQLVVEIDKSTGQPRHGLPIVNLFTEKGPV